MTYHDALGWYILHYTGSNQPISFLPLFFMQEFNFFTFDYSLHILEMFHEHGEFKTW